MTASFSHVQREPNLHLAAEVVHFQEMIWSWTDSLYILGAGGLESIRPLLGSPVVYPKLETFPGHSKLRHVGWDRQFSDLMFFVPKLNSLTGQRDTKYEFKSAASLCYPIVFVSEYR